MGIDDLREDDEGRRDKRYFHSSVCLRETATLSSSYEGEFLV